MIRAGVAKLSTVIAPVPASVAAWSIVALVVAFAPAGGNRLDYWAWDAAGVFVVLAATTRQPTAP